MAVMRAANPEADDARPQPVGKLFSVSISSGGTSKVQRSSVKKRLIFASSTDSPFKTKRSLELVVTDVVVVNVSSVIDNEGVAGRLPGPGCLPQYFTSAMFGWAIAVPWLTVGVKRSALQNERVPVARGRESSGQYGRGIPSRKYLKGSGAVLRWWRKLESLVF